MSFTTFFTVYAGKFTVLHTLLHTLYILYCKFTALLKHTTYFVTNFVTNFTVYTGTLRRGDAATPRESRTLAPVLFRFWERGLERKRQWRHASERGRRCTRCNWFFKNFVLKHQWRHASERGRRCVRCKKI